VCQLKDDKRHISLWIVMNCLLSSRGRVSAHQIESQMHIDIRGRDCEPTKGMDEPRLINIEMRRQIICMNTDIIVSYQSIFRSTHTYIYIYINAYVNQYIYTETYVYMYIYIYIYIYTCIYIYTYLTIYMYI
jgi:hypothetical protein